MRINQAWYLTNPNRFPFPIPYPKDTGMRPKDFAASKKRSKKNKKRK